jgi:Uma2 family endonuclease
MSAITTAPAPVGTTTPPPAGAGPKLWKWTREEYYRLGALGFFHGKRVELIRGQIVEMSPINIAHATGVGLVTDALAVVFAAGFYINGQQPFAVPGAAAGTEPQPDVAVIPGSRRPATVHPSAAALPVEVADSTLYYDTTTKAQLYAEVGVADYWVLDLNGRQLRVFRDPPPLPPDLTATAYRTHDTFGPNDTVSPLAAPHASVRVADLLP